MTDTVISLQRERAARLLHPTGESAYSCDCGCESIIGRVRRDGKRRLLCANCGSDLTADLRRDY